MRSTARERSMISAHCARPGAERCDRPAKAADSAIGDHPGRLAHGPEEKHGLAGRRVGLMVILSVTGSSQNETDEGLVFSDETYAKDRRRSIRRVWDRPRQRRAVPLRRWGPPLALKNAKASGSEDREADDRVVPGLANLRLDA